MNYRQYTIEDLLESSFMNHMHFVSKYNIIEDHAEFDILLEDLNMFQKLINKIIEVYENYSYEMQEINNAIFTALTHYKTKFQNNIEPLHLYSFVDFDNLKNYNEILKNKKIENVINKYEKNLELFVFVTVLLRTQLGLFIKDKDYEKINIRKEVLLTKLENF